MGKPKQGRPRESQPEPKTEAARVFGERLRAEREKASISRERLAEMTGVSADTIARYEDGTFEPKLVPAMKLAEAIGVRFSSLINGLPISGK